MPLIQRNRRNEDYTKVFIDTCQHEVKTNMSSKYISKITRLGRKIDDGTRRLLVSMSSQDVKKKIMQQIDSKLLNLRSSNSIM